MPRWFTLEDAKTSFNLFCCVYGIGTLGMPANFARAGPVFATLALLFMAFANTYASVAISRVMLAAPSSVQTFGDIGEWACGSRGRWAVVVSQLSVCLLVPCAFLVLGGTLLQVLFPHSFSGSFWIVFMALMVLPVCLIPTLKEGAGVALAGCLATILSDMIAMGVMVHGMKQVDAPVQSPEVSVGQVFTTFGNLSLAYGAGIVIPDLQRQHSRPTQMPRVIGATLGFISLLFLLLGTTGYGVAGCQISGNLLFSITSVSHGETDTSPLGFIPHRGAVVMAYFFMQMHITIAFAVLLHPAFYTAERLLLGMHQQKAYHDMEASAGDLKPESEGEEATDDDVGEYAGTKSTLRYTSLRFGIVTMLVLLALALQDHFLDLADFIGATCISLSCLILPLAFYVQVFRQSLSIIERRLALAIIAVSSLAGLYVVLAIAMRYAKEDPAEASQFPFCPAQ